MQIGTFRKNVMKTVAVKAAKLGLRQVSKNTARTNVAHATVSLKTGTGRLMQALSKYVLGDAFSPTMQEAALPVFGDIGYALTILCRALKVKMPTATKKSKLTGTRTAALLHLDALATDLLAVVEVGTFGGPVTALTKKMVVLPNKGGEKEEREVVVIDADAEKAAEAARQEEMRGLLTNFVDTYWRLCYDIFKQAPEIALQNKFDRLKADHPEVEFDVTETPDAELAGVGQ